MAVLVWAVLVGFPLVVLLAMAGYVHLDAARYGMNSRKWAAVAFFVPFFGFFAYLFERDELLEDPAEEMFVDGPFEIHESRAEDTPFAGTGEESGEFDGSGGGSGDGSSERP